ncbi:hypothetical protein GCM10023185_35020 [Hymenobacter saemangeumensis]|uniref:PqqD family protein n=1 Tax=Hymenobacter saemangeumensis TaxID=1084522 RepID=A0ABP8IQ97_9BACT
MKLKPTIAISAAGLLFNPATGDSFSANPVAIEILGLLREEQTPGAAKAALMARYEVEAHQLDKDWDDLVAQMREHNLLD